MIIQKISVLKQEDRGFSLRYGDYKRTFVSSSSYKANQFFITLRNAHSKPEVMIEKSMLKTSRTLITKPFIPTPQPAPNPKKVSVAASKGSSSSFPLYEED
jgi:hypothetical protein